MNSPRDDDYDRAPRQPGAPALAGRVEELLRAPLAASMFVLAEEHGFGPDDLADPGTVTALAAAAAAELDPWNGAEPAADVRRRMVDGAAALRPLVTAVLCDPRNSWWDAVLDRSHQLLLADDTATVTRTSVEPGPAKAGWETYAQQPADSRVRTTTELTEAAAAGAHPIRSGAHAALAYGQGDWSPTYPLHQSLVAVSPQARIFEIAAPGHWNKLVTRYARRYAGPDPNLLTVAGLDHGPGPDWAAVAADFDGIHLTFAGLLSSLYVPWPGTETMTTLWAWEWEQTVWLRPSFSDRTALLDLLAPPDPPLALLQPVQLRHPHGSSEAD